LLIAGGNSNNGANDGPFYLNSNNSSLNRNINIGALIACIFSQASHPSTEGSAIISNTSFKAGW